MRNHLLHIAVLLSLLGLASCQDRMPAEDPTTGSGTVDGKSPIVLSVGGVDSPDTEVTRAVITDGTGKTMKNFSQAASIFMVMKSEYDNDHEDYQGEKTDKYTVSRGRVEAGGNTVAFDATNQKYWDDAHARSSQLSIWAYASKCPANWYECNFQTPKSDWTPEEPETPEHMIQEYEDHKYNTSSLIGWELQGSKGSKGAIYPCIMLWRASHNTTGEPQYRQDANSVQYQDLLFSNNLANNGVGKDKRLKFDFANHRFPQSGEAEMKFYHAMSKITIHIKKGVGFGGSFNFTPSTSNVRLKKCNTEGTFNIKDGEFQQIKASYDIPQIYLHASPDDGDAFTLEALAVPNIHAFLSAHGGSDGNSRFVKDAKNLPSDVMMEFTIENSLYRITSGQLYDALVNNSDEPVSNATKKDDNGTYIPMEAGKNYVFTFTIGMSGISNITAQVADWENVAADPQNLTNAHIKLQLEERGTAQTEDVAFYKAEDNNTSATIDFGYATYNWKTGYTNLDATYSTNHWTTSYYWKSNKDFYHFRALMPDETTVYTDGSGDGDYVTLTSAGAYTDIRWGAPFNDDADNETPGTFKWTYDPTTYGFDNVGHTQIYKAIGASEDVVKLILFHMMSDLTINIKTSDGEDKVELCHDNGNSTYQRTKLDLVSFYNGGKVLLGTGLVKTTGSASTIGSPVTIPFNTATNNTSYVQQVYKFGAVPQNLTNVQLYITTPDNNQYIVNLAGAKVLSGNITSNNLANPYRLVGGTGADKDKYIIDRWYPGFKYTYTFKLTKKGIESLTATIVDWEEIEADEETVTIK